MTPIRIRKASTILDEIEGVYDDITRRAYEKFLSRGSASASAIDIEDWLEAERELLLKPEANITEKHGHFVVRFLIPKIDPADLTVLATRDDLIIQSAGRYPEPRIFRAVHLCSPIDLTKIRANLVSGRLIVVALKAAFTEAREVGRDRSASAALHTARR